MIRSRIPAIARKETLHILRDWRTLAAGFVVPMIMILLFGYAITFDIRDLKLAVADEDQTKASRELVRRFTASGYFVLVATRDHPDQLGALLDAGRAQIALAIPKDYAKNLETMRGEKVQIVFDGSESNTATIAAGYVDALLAGINLEQVSGALARFGLPARGLPPIDGRVRIWFNPELKSSHTIIPGLVAVIMMVMSALLTSLTIVREREMGSLEGLIATPVRRYEILIGKVIPYLTISLVDCVLVAGLGVFVFGMPFNGSLPLFAGTALIFAFAGLGIGLLASVIASNQLFANQIVVLSTMLPSYLLSGFMFPIKSMPDWLQPITYVFPARYFIQICRGIMLKDQPASDLVRPTAFLLVLGVILLTMSVLRFHKKLES
jgi:ABC-2 type transport system permease protein